MDEIKCSVTTSPCMKEWMVQADFPKEVNLVKKKTKTNGRLLLLSSNILTLYFKDGQ